MSTFTYIPHSLQSTSTTSFEVVKLLDVPTSVHRVTINFNSDLYIAVLPSNLVDPTDITLQTYGLLYASLDGSATLDVTDCSIWVYSLADCDYNITLFSTM